MLVSYLLSTDAMRRRRSQMGFTLVELMVVVAIIGILAAVGIAAYTKWVRKSKASGEVPYMLGHFQQREVQYQAENGTFLPTGSTEDDYFPKPLTGGGSYTSIPTGTTPQAWQDLKIQMGQSGLYCGYVVLVKAAGAAAGANGAALYPVAPNREFFYVRAECDWNGDGGGDGNNVWVVRGDTSVTAAIQTGANR